MKSVMSTCIVSMRSWLRCCHCLQVVTAVEAVVRGRAWACKRCNGARVALERHYKETNRMHLWMHMGREEKNNVIISNKFKSQGQGKKFPIKIAEEAMHGRGGVRWRQCALCKGSVCICLHSVRWSKKTRWS